MPDLHLDPNHNPNPRINMFGWTWMSAAICVVTVLGLCGLIFLVYWFRKTFRDEIMKQYHDGR